MSRVETVSCGVWVGSGAERTGGGQWCRARLLEHMAFKGFLNGEVRRILSRKLSRSAVI